jgi:hypothetical protein
VWRILLALILLVIATPARADLMGDADVLETVWSKAQDSRVKRLAPIFLHDGETRRVALVDSRTEALPCMAFVAIAERHQRFVLSTSAASEPVESRAGVARLVDCGGGALSLPAKQRRVEIAMTSGRGTIELIRATYATQLSPVDVILPERAVGPVGKDEDAPGGLELAPMKDRVARARRSSRLDGASTIMPLSLRATDAGAGSTVLRLSAGCHRLHLVSDTGVGGAADLDADVRRHEDGTVLDRDRSHAPDARLSACVGVDRRVEVRFNGAPSRAKVTLLDAFWPIPAGVPVMWGARARAGLAWAVHRRSSPKPQTAPIVQTLGGPGVTALASAVVPGACYLAAFAVARGEAATSRLSVHIGPRRAHDDANDLMRSAAVTFCAKAGERLARFRFDVRARDAWWIGALWRVGGLHAP